MDVLPDEQYEILFEDRLDVGGAKSFSDGAAMLVIDDAVRLVQHFPSALPREKSEVGVFQVERRKKFVESAQLQKFPAIERAGSAAAVEARVQVANLRVDVMAHSQSALMPPSFCKA